MPLALAGPVAGLGAGLVAGLVALAAWRAHTLTAGGAVAAWAVGTAILLGTGWAGGAVLAAFFVSASAVGRLAPRAARAGRVPAAGDVPADTAPALDAKGDCRDAWQVGANGGVAALAALLPLAAPALALPAAPTGRLALWLVTAALAAAGADTWATAVGAGARHAPRHLLTGRPVPRGTSGGVTGRGTLGGVAGALLVAATGAVAVGGAALLAAATLAGLGGMLADSALGAAVQGRFRCERCGVASEWPRHRCGARTTHVGGWRWLTNDGVNLLATLTGALLGALGWLLARGTPVRP
ncbi:MAG TPA: DUF92 domain-containing protein [Gemmatimonadales bacterium]|nr:DUF92 domain-containing protein [Gemmatimonadales bacterium]